MPTIYIVMLSSLTDPALGQPPQSCAWRIFCLLFLCRGPRPQGLAIAELNHVAIWGTNPAVIAHRIRFLTWFPDQIPSHPRLVGDGIHRRLAVERKAQMAIIRGRLLSAVPAWH